LDYPQNRYIAAVGAAANRANAEKQAFAALAAFFGQSVKSDIAVSAAYSQAVRNGIVSVSEKTEVRETIVTAAALDNLIGAAIGGIWEDGRGTVSLPLPRCRKSFAGCWGRGHTVKALSPPELIGMIKTEVQKVKKVYGIK
jgi:hypothetical protein